MIKTSLVLVVAILLSACGPGLQVTGNVASCRTTLDALSALTAGLEIPENFQDFNPVKKGGEFDVMQYFDVLDHLAMAPGYVLDYVYRYDGMGGSPILYARPVSQSPYPTEAELASSGNTASYLDYVQADDTPGSYFQLVLLSLLGEEFYLYWHANYGDIQVVCEKIDVRGIVAGLDGNFGYRISLLSRFRAALLNHVQPTVQMDEEAVQVRLVTFTRWGGFYEQIYTINHSMPHSIQDIQRKNLVPYDCGVMF